LRVQPLKVGVGLLLIFYSAWMGLVRRPPIVTGGGGWLTLWLASRRRDGRHGEPQRPAPVIWAQLRAGTCTSSAASNQPFNMAVLALAVVTAAIAGFLNAEFLIFVVFALPTTLIGARLGLSLYGKVDERSSVSSCSACSASRARP